jgi:hypothetical protein
MGGAERTGSNTRKACPDQSSATMEHAAREGVDSSVGRRHDEVERACMRSRLLDFAAILRSWDRKHNATSVVGNVDAICRREP